ncbi:hypothetical protein PPERSA_06741 [Pseudocohnilembus persalinus]|uniref:Uncharacterized protein n=1 Tax=Pseudocohnilembus persalinus TaxID=266149 RepID=A0A0V0QS37_PSEPJ|nr:hypothetical protein PPERSA_06741 [Pseudocohnilembus persalinus]|eukprot:KRX05107.1 hypothetical protein PPERSA_06741 [Pseudocohnilembus persalinus]
MALSLSKDITEKQITRLIKVLHTNNFFAEYVKKGQKQAVLVGLFDLETMFKYSEKLGIKFQFENDENLQKNQYGKLRSSLNKQVFTVSLQLILFNIEQQFLYDNQLLNKLKIDFGQNSSIDKKIRKCTNGQFKAVVLAQVKIILRFS